MNTFQHFAVPAPLDDQPIVRLNRDTLYSVAVVDVTSPVTLRMPDAGERYMSAMIVNQDHFIPEILHGQGEYVLSREKHGTDVVMIGVRTLVDPVRHLIGSAAGWGGLPEHEANYVSVFPGLAPGEYTMRMADVPVDAFWSVSVYDAEGFFDPSTDGYCNLNSITATKEDDGAVVIRFGVEPDGTPNFLTVKEGWNLLIRQYQPRAEALDGTWQVPAITPVSAAH